LYGTTTGGGTNNAGIIFRLALNKGNFNSFAFGSDKTFQLAVTGAALNYRIDASTNLLNWLTVPISPIRPAPIITWILTLLIFQGDFTGCILRPK